MLYQWTAVFGYLGQLLQAALVTLEITFLAFVLALLLGILAALGRNSSIRSLRFVAGAYVEAIRNTPVLLQVFVAYFAVPSLGIHITSFTAGVIALGINVGAYLAEVFRAGISSVTKASSRRLEYSDSISGKCLYLSCSLKLCAMSIQPWLIISSKYSSARPFFPPSQFLNLPVQPWRLTRKR